MIDFFQIQSDLNDLLVATDFTTVVHPTGQNIDPKFYIEAMERDMSFDNMPMFNIRLIEGEVEVRSLPNGYYIVINFEIDVIAFDFTEYKNAANIRDDLLQIAMDSIRSQPQFSGTLNDSMIGPQLQFSAGAPEGAGGHVAAVTFQVTATAYVESNVT